MNFVGIILGASAFIIIGLYIFRNIYEYIDFSL